MVKGYPKHTHLYVWSYTYIDCVCLRVCVRVCVGRLDNQVVLPAGRKQIHVLAVLVTGVLFIHSSSTINTDFFTIKMNKLLKLNIYSTNGATKAVSTFTTPWVNSAGDSCMTLFLFLP